MDHYVLAERTVTGRRGSYGLVGSVTPDETVQRVTGSEWSIHRPRRGWYIQLRHPSSSATCVELIPSRSTGKPLELECHLPFLPSPVDAVPKSPTVRLSFSDEPASPRGSYFALRPGLGERTKGIEESKERGYLDRMARWASGSDSSSFSCSLYLTSSSTPEEIFSFIDTSPCAFHLPLLSRLANAHSLWSTSTTGALSLCTSALSSRFDDLYTSEGFWIALFFAYEGFLGDHAVCAALLRRWRRNLTMLQGWEAANRD